MNPHQYRQFSSVHIHATTPESGNAGPDDEEIQTVELGFDDVAGEW